MANPINGWLDTECYSAESSMQLHSLSPDTHFQLCKNSTRINATSYTVEFLQKSNRFHDHYRHLVDDFGDLKELNRKANEVKANYTALVHNSKLVDNCSSDKAIAIRVGVGVFYIFI